MYNRRKWKRMVICCLLIALIVGMMPTFAAAEGADDAALTAELTGEPAAQDDEGVEVPAAQNDGAAEGTPAVTAEAPTSISLSVGADETEMGFTWYSNVNTTGTLLLAENSELQDGTMPESAKSIETEGAATSKAGYYSYQVTAKNLEADTTYAYQIRLGETVSKIYTFTTGGSDGYTFALVGDPQIGASGNGANDGTNWGKTLTKIANDANFKGTDFILSVGDQVNKASDETQYNQYLDHEELCSLPVATVIGNHDTSSSAYGDHFNVANESDTYGVTDAGGDSYFVYQNTLFMVINTNDRSTAEHKAFMEQAIIATEGENIKWKVVTLHHSVFSVATHATEGDILQRRNELVPVFENLDIDVVLMGHDHVYVRSYIMDGLTPVTESESYEYNNGTSKAPTAVNDPDGILYVTVNSASGSKYYNIQNTQFTYAAVKNQEKTPNISRVDVTDDTFRIITYRLSNNELSVVDTFTIKRTNEDRDFSESVNTESENGVIDYLDSYVAGSPNEDGGVAEIAAFNSDNDCMYIVSGQTKTLDIARIDASGQTSTVKKVDMVLLGKLHDFNVGDITSVDVNTARDMVAVAVQDSDYSKNGTIVLLDYNGAFVTKYEAGVQPDMITFTPDGSMVLTANEGEPREGYGEGTVDPKGSVTVVNLERAAAQTVIFDGLNRETLIENGVLLKTGSSPDEDLEPEYIAVSTDSKTAYITLQENNAIAALNLADLSWKYVKGLGFKDHSVEGNGLDLDADGKVDIRTENVYGVYMPDGIAYTTINGKEYLLTANEGDAREWGDYENTDSAKLTLSDGEKAGKKIEYLKADSTDGLEDGKIYLLGGRSFSIWDAETLEQVYDSGDSIEEICAENFPDWFNSSNDGAGELDKRSNKKGPEPESVETVTVNGKTYALVGLERIGGVMMFDITNPNRVSYVDYLNVRDFSCSDLAQAGDLGAEGICVVSTADSPTGKTMVLVSNEVSGTVTVAQLEIKKGSGGNQGIIVNPDSGKDDKDDDSDKSDDKKDDSSETTVTYSDVTKHDWFYDAVQTVSSEKLMVGIGNNLFGPNYAINRAMMVTVLYRMAGSPEVKETSGFSDVTVGSYYADAVAWAKSNNLVEGVGNGLFAPEKSLSRQEMAVMLYRYAQFEGANMSGKGDISDYTDRPASWAQEAMEWCVGNGIINGTTKTTLSPTESATRAQMAAVLARFLQKTEK